MITKFIRLSHYLRLNFQSQKIENCLLEERDDKSFKCSYILILDDKMFIRYSAAQQTMEWIVESNSFKDIINYDELQRAYELSRYQSKYFLHSKDDYTKIAKTLPFTMSETLFIFPCDKIFENYFLNHFNCSNFLPQDFTIQYFTHKRSNKVNFENLNELIAHVKKV